MNFYYDLHIHSCLSPCAEDQMTPATIAGLAKINGLDFVALTDHNSVKNCPAFKVACEFYGVTPLFGAELTTSEDVHIICLFGELEEALSFGEWIDGRKILYKNKPEIFGNQLIMNEDDETVGIEDNLLINATTVSIDEAYAEVTERGGACYPAHIDRDSNGIIAMLGAFPDEPRFTAYELNDADNRSEMMKLYPNIEGLMFLCCSDAHYVGNISERKNCIDLPSAKPDADILIKYLRGEL